MPVCSPAETAAARQDWPLATKLELGPFPSAIPCARIHARLVLAEWNLSHIADEAELIVSELATNAIKATGQPIIVSLTSNRRTLVVAIRDSLTEAPRPRSHALDAESGRGLEIVTMLSDRWGVHHSQTGGKIVWAVLPAIDKSSSPTPVGPRTAEERSC